MTVVFVAEKRASALALARALGAEDPRGDPIRIGSEPVGQVWVTWLNGHVAELVEPGQLEPRWRAWSLETLPMLPRTVPWRVSQSTSTRFEAARKAVSDRSVERVVCATDAGREGELIFSIFAELADIRVPISRLWTSSLAPAGLARALDALEPAEARRGLERAARGRAWADWWVGMNASRALTLTRGEAFSAGRVQTPTLALLLERAEARRDFVPATHVTVSTEVDGGWTAHWACSPELEEGRASRASPDDVRLGEIGTEARAAWISEHEAQSRTVPPPLLFDLDTLQREAFHRLGLTAKQTLELAQELYEKHELLSYPRTNARHLGEEDADALAQVAAMVARQLGVTAPSRARPTERVVDASKVEDHGALVPTGAPIPPGLSDEARAVWEMVARQSLVAFEPPCEERLHRVVVEDERGQTWVAGFVEVQQLGFRTLLPAPLAELPPPDLFVGRALELGAPRFETGQSSPPPSHDDASLLEEMGALGLGTPATRADLIERLITKGYARREGPSLVSTALGERLVASSPPALRSAKMTAELEAQLAAVEAGEMSLEAFVTSAHESVRVLVAAIASGELAAATAEVPGLVSMEPPIDRPEGPLDPAGRAELSALAREGLDPELLGAVSEAAREGQSLVVSALSPWQAPRVAMWAWLERGGRAIVTSADISVMEDEVMSARALGVRADRLHGGQSREALRQISRAYLDRQVDLLFFEPELLEREGVDRMLARGEPNLLVVDGAERAAATSAAFDASWARLARALPEVPRILVGVAQPRIVLEDASALLAPDAGWALAEWPQSWALEVVSVEPRHRVAALGTLLASSFGQAWVWVRSLDEVERVCRELGPAAVGLSGEPAARREAQERFRSGEAPVMVATVGTSPRLEAPGLGTVVFLAAPSTLSEFGGPALVPSLLEAETRAVVFVDPKARDEPRLPPRAALELVERGLAAEPRSRAELEAASALEPETFDRYLRLLRGRGALFETEEGWLRGDPSWRRGYDAALAFEGHERALLQSVLQTNACRSIALSAALGRRSSLAEPCGLCDGCDPEGARLAPSEPASPEMLALADGILRSLRRSGAISLRGLQDDLRGVRRGLLEELVEAMTSEGWLRRRPDGRLEILEPPSPSELRRLRWRRPWVPPAR